jgi:UDP-2-acetamido-2,6-beta-L-arabino-hexul-4-ose reductase
MGMRVAVTGAHGFIGSHVMIRLDLDDRIAGVAVRREAFTDTDALAETVAGADAVVHLAALNRAPDQEDVYATNVRLIETLIAALDVGERPPHVLFASSVQRHTDTPYGRAKRKGERLLEAWAASRSAHLSILEVPNVFGPGCRPFSNSVVATFAHQLARGEQPQVHEDRVLPLLYVGDLADAIVELVRWPEPGHAWPTASLLEAGGRRPAIGPVYHRSVSQVRDDLDRYARAHAGNRTMPNARSRMDDLLHRTYVSHLPDEALRFAPPVHRDERGSLVECVRQQTGGQVFFSVTRPGAVRGQHFHLHKVEKFCVVRGQAVIRLRGVRDGNVRELRVSGDHPEVVDIPVAQVHNIENVGDDDLCTVFWASEVFDPSSPDTHPEVV